MISLFALIMALGIIVDDAIVVGEDALAHYQMGEPPLLAAEGGARRMLAPVVASSLTTIAAFLPLMLIGGRIGNILFAIPLVIVSVILASLIESFFVLPGHLRHSFIHAHKVRPRSLRGRLDRGFSYFRDGCSGPCARLAITTYHRQPGLRCSDRRRPVGRRAAELRLLSHPRGADRQRQCRLRGRHARARVDAFLEHLRETLYRDRASAGAGQSS